MGPGGLDVLKSGTGNRRVVCLPCAQRDSLCSSSALANTHPLQSLAAPSRPPPRSILKPTIPLLQEIPPHKPKKGNASTGPGASGSNRSDNTDNSGTKVALRTEEEQQAAAREREERERTQMEKEVNDRREARRKSLANRRVSFAAEATLHTFHEVEYMQDSTTSTDSTRRTSSVAAPSPAPLANEHESDGSEPPSTPPEQAETVAESPANQRDLHQKKHRRSSGAASNYNDDDTIYDSDLEHADDITEIQGEEMTDSSDDSEEDGTLMTVEAEEMTSASVASMASLHSAFSGDSTGELDENLRLAARTAATQRLDDDEEVIAGFAGWGKKNTFKENVTQEVKPAMVDKEPGSDAEMTMDMDMDMTNAVGGILQPAEGNEDEDEDMDMSMDVTKALGGILPKPNTQSWRKSVRVAPKPWEDATSFGDMTMEFTTAVGGIKPSRISDVSHLTTDSNEDMSMEITAAVGAVLAGGLAKTGAQNNRRRTIANEDDEASMMEMTMAVGRILADPAEEGDGETMGMDMTMAVGGIIKPSPAQTPEVRSAARKVMELEADQPDPSVTDSVEIAPPSPKRRSSRGLDDKSSSDLAAFQGKSIPRSPIRSPSPKAKPAPTVASSPSKASSPFRSPSPKARTPSKTKTPPAMLGSRSSSPVRPVSPAKTTPRSPSKTKKLFHQDPNTGTSTPRVILTPQGRRLSGVGADRSGLGSPKVAEIFDRRVSIGDAATSFIPGQAANARRAVAFADPRAMEAEIDRERQGEEEKDNSRQILQREADGLQNGPKTSQSLKEMIQGLSPKKNPLRGRKSLHVGSARGLLGKRPAELDDEEAEDAGGVKRLKGHQGSPVKNIRLQSPPSKAETTTGRKARAGLRSADNTATDIITPTVASSPKHQSRFKIVDDQPTTTMDFDHTVPMGDAEMQQDEDGERIHLQDFLNMTSIRFMELTTTKRRHTVVPTASRDSSAPDGKEDISLEKCAVAGACTVPMLELYQHVS